MTPSPQSGKLALLTANAGTVFIAAGAFWLSFTALADLAERSGIHSRQAWAWPLIVDGIIVVATVAAVALAGQRSAWYPWLLLGFGAAVSVTANAIHAIVTAAPGVPPALAASVASVPPVVLLAITHLTVLLNRHRAQQRARATRPEESPTGGAAPIAPPPQPAVVSWPSAVIGQPAPVPPAPMPAPRETRPILPSLRPEPRSAPRAPVPVSATPSPKPKRTAPVSGAVNRARAEALRAEGMSNKKIAQALGVHPSTVGRWFPQSDSTDAKPTPDLDLTVNEGAPE